MNECVDAKNDEQYTIVHARWRRRQRFDLRVNPQKDKRRNIDGIAVESID